MIRHYTVKGKHEVLAITSNSSARSWLLIVLGIIAAFVVSLSHNVVISKVFYKVTNKLHLMSAGEQQATLTMPVPSTLIGMNLGSPAYWSTEWTFNDPIQSTGELFFYEAGQNWPSRFNGQTAQDANGRPVNVAAGAQFMIQIQNHGGPWMGGKFTCHVAPGWEVAAIARENQLTQNGTSFTMVSPAEQVDKRLILVLKAKMDHASLSELSCQNIADRGLF